MISTRYRSGGLPGWRLAGSGLLLLILAGVHGAGWEVQVSHGPADAFTPDVGLGPDGSAHVVWVSEHKVFYSRVGPDGTNLVPAMELYGSNPSSFPRIVVDDANDAHVVFMISALSLGTQTLYLRLNPEGAKEVQRLVTIPPRELPGVINENYVWPAITLVPVTQVPAVITDVSFVFPGTLPWVPPFLFAGVANPPVWMLGVDYDFEWITAMTLDAAGDVASRTNLWWEVRPTDPTRDRSKLPAVAADSRGRLHGVWNYTEADDTFQIAYGYSGAPDFHTISENPVPPWTRPAIACDTNDTLHVAWTARNRVIYTCLDRAGDTLVDDTVVVNSTEVQGPTALAVAGETACLVWAELRNGSTNIYGRAVWNCVAFGAEQELSEGPGERRSPAASWRTNQPPAVVWVERRGGTDQVILWRPARLDGPNWSDWPDLPPDLFVPCGVFTRGQVTPGGQERRTFQADLSATSRYVTLVWTNGVLRLRLFAPGGREVFPGEPGVRWITVAGATQCFLAAPAVGVWTAQIEAIETDPGGEDFSLMVECDSHLAFDLSAEEPPTTGSSVRVFARFAEAGQPVVDAVVDATVSFQGRQLERIVLTDNGQRPDDAARDGVYTGQFLAEETDPYELIADGRAAMIGQRIRLATLSLRAGGGLVRPRLLPRRAEDRLVLSWTTSDPGFILEGKTDLSEPVWVEETLQPMQIGPDQFEVAVPLGGQRFLRLRGEP